MSLSRHATNAAQDPGTTASIGADASVSRSACLEITRWSVPFRYAWPAELDLMAQLAGMSLRERWSGWKKEPFTSESREHVSVWQKPV